MNKTLTKDQMIKKNEEVEKRVKSRLNVLGLPEDNHLLKVKARFDDWKLWKRYYLQGRQTMWLETRTRWNIYYLYKYIYDLDKINKKRGFHYINSISKGLKLSRGYVRPLLLITCMMKNNLLKWNAYRSYSKSRLKPKVVQRIVRV